MWRDVEARGPARSWVTGVQGRRNTEGTCWTPGGVFGSERLRQELPAVILSSVKKKKDEREKTEAVRKDTDAALTVTGDFLRCQKKRKGGKKSGGVSSHQMVLSAPHLYSSPPQSRWVMREPLEVERVVFSVLLIWTRRNNVWFRE